jgi:hypothetical protein
MGSKWLRAERNQGRWQLYESENGRQSAGKRSRHLNICFFFVKDQKEKGNLSIQYCPTDHMIGDFMTKPLHSKKSAMFRQAIMNLPCATQMMMAACVTDMHRER